MTQSSTKTAPAAPHSNRTLPRRLRSKIASEWTVPEDVSLSKLLDELKSVGERAGSALGGAYALAARALLEGVERIEDRNAARRHLLRAPGATARGAAALQTEPSSSPAK